MLVLTNEKFKKVSKYLFLCMTIMFACVSVPEKQMKLSEAFIIGIFGSTIFVVFDLIFPAICIHKNKN
jgi:hypothetical protein